jgi:hypothetical protein
MTWISISTLRAIDPTHRQISQLRGTEPIELNISCASATGETKVWASLLLGTALSNGQPPPGPQALWCPPGAPVGDVTKQPHDFSAAGLRQFGGEKYLVRSRNPTDFLPHAPY